MDTRFFEAILYSLLGIVLGLLAVAPLRFERYDTGSCHGVLANDVAANIKSSFPYADDPSLGNSEIDVLEMRGVGSKCRVTYRFGGKGTHSRFYEIKEDSTIGRASLPYGRMRMCQDPLCRGHVEDN